MTVRSRASLGELAGPREIDRGPAVDAVGIVLLAALAGWVLLASSGSGGDARPTVGLLLIVGAAFALARLIGRQERTLGPLFLLALALGVVVVATSEVLSSAPLSGPFGYVNAKAAFFLQASVAGVMVGLGSSWPPARVAGAVMAVGFAGIVMVSASIAAAGLLVALPAIALAVTAWRGSRAGVAICAALFGIALAGTIVLGAAYEPGKSISGPHRLSTERRLTLWSEALEITADRPLMGVGPGRFQAVSPTALADRDARWAHHAFLQVGSETGVVGLVLLAGVFAWGFARLFAGPGDVVTVLGAAALAALGIHACLDYVLHFAPVLIAAALLLGGATSRQRGHQ